MGAWGAKVFDSDDARDIRDGYREKLLLGASDSEAEQEIIEEFQIPKYPELWLPLAVTEWKTGRLSDSVRLNALSGIDREIEELPGSWKPQLIENRKTALLKARMQLASPMPVPNELRMQWYSFRCPWEVGNVLQYRITDAGALAGCYVLLLVRGVEESTSDKIPMDSIAVSLYEWCSHTPPIDMEDGSGLKAKQIDYILQDNSLMASQTIDLSKWYVKRHDIRCVRKTPLSSSDDDYSPVPIVGSDVYFEEAICKTLRFIRIFD